MNVKALTETLERILREELAAKDRCLELMADQVQAIRENRPEELERATLAIEELLSSGSGCTARRSALFDLLAEHWKVDRGSLSIGSILERIGVTTGPLVDLRAALTERAARVAVESRRVNTLVIMHRSIIHDVLCSALALDASPGAPIESGSLVDAEA